MIDFKGAKLNFIQVGLGTYSTFIQNLAGTRDDWCSKIDWLFQTSSEQRPWYVKGISVEPVKDIVETFDYIPGCLPGVQLVNAALGESDDSGVQMYSFSRASRDKVLEHVSPTERKRLHGELEYLLNMSSIGEVHPMFPDLSFDTAKRYNIWLDMDCEHEVDVWSWNKLVRAFNFTGCEVLLIDAEGYDTKILRSLMAHCQEHPESWPEIIVFETHGHCDRREYAGAEWEMINDLQKQGYLLMSLSDHDTYLVRAQSLEDELRLQKWSRTWYCCACYSRAIPYYSVKQGSFCKECFDFLTERKEINNLALLGRTHWQWRWN